MKTHARLQQCHVPRIFNRFRMFAIMSLKIAAFQRFKTAKKERGLHVIAGFNDLRSFKSNVTVWLQSFSVKCQAMANIVANDNQII